MATPFSLTRTKFLTMSVTTGQYDLPTSSPNVDSADRNTTEPCLEVISQSESPQNVYMLPRSALHSQSLDRGPCPGLSSNITTERDTESDNQNRGTEDNQTPGPAQPPPLPPKTRTVTSKMSPASANSGYYHTLKTSNDLNMKPPDKNSERAPSPLPPPRPERTTPPHISCSTSEYELTLPQIELRPKPSHSVHGNPQRSPRPPRPERPSSHTKPHSPSRCEAMPPPPEPLLQPSHSVHGYPQSSLRPPQPERPFSRTRCRSLSPSSTFEAMPLQPELRPQSKNQIRDTEVYQSPRPARPPLPVPLKTKAVTSPASVNSRDYYHLKTSNELNVKPLDTTNRERAPSPLPPPRPDRPTVPPRSHSSSSEYERTLPQIELRPQIRPQGSDGYEDTRHSPVPRRKSLSTPMDMAGHGSLSYKNANASGNYLPGRPIKPPPPSFNPPPPPIASKLSPYNSPTLHSAYDTESLYSEIDEYLEILPEETDHKFQPSYSVYNPICTMTHSESPRYQNFPVRTPVTEDKEDFEKLMRWMRTVGYCEKVPLSLYGLSVEQEAREFNQSALHVKKGLRLFNYLLINRNDSLHSHISALNSIADNLEKMQNTSKMGIAGGTAGAVGGVTAIVGIALAPVTMGISLVATAVGAGLVATGGSMGHKAAKANKNSKIDRIIMERLVADYRAEITDVDRCLSLIRCGMDKLRQYDICRLQGAGVDSEALRMATVAQNVHRSAVFRAVGNTSVTSESLLQVFAKNIDLYFTEKDGRRLKKGTEHKFAAQVRLLAKDLGEELNELNKVWETFTCAAHI